MPETATTYTGMERIPDETKGSITEGRFHSLITTKTDPPIVTLVRTSSRVDLRDCAVTKVTLDDELGAPIHCFRTMRVLDTLTVYYYFIPIPDLDFSFTPSIEA